MTLSLSEIDAVVAELAEALAGAVLAGADALPGPAILLRFDVGGKVRKVLLTARLHVSRLHLTTRRFEAAERERASAQDRAFADRVFRELRGTPLLGVRRILDDRVVEFAFQGRQHPRGLVFECSGQHPNVFLCDDRHVILAMLGSSKSQRRDLRPGARYARPLKHEHDTVETLRFVGHDGSVSERVEAFYQDDEARSDRVQAVAGIQAALKAGLMRQLRLIEAIEGDLSKARVAEAEKAGEAAAEPVAETGAQGSTAAEPVEVAETGARETTAEEPVEVAEAGEVEAAPAGAVETPAGEGESAVEAVEAPAGEATPAGSVETPEARSEERRVGKEGE